MGKTVVGGGIKNKLSAESGKEEINVFKFSNLEPRFEN